MAVELPEWRLGDAAAYENAMAVADDLLGALMLAFRGNPVGSAALRDEASRVRSVATMLDGFDRDATEQLHSEWVARLAELGVWRDRGI